MDLFLIKWVNSECPLSHYKCVKKWLFLDGLWWPLNCVCPHPPPKMVSLWKLYRPTHLVLYPNIRVSAQCFQDIFSEKTHFSKYTWMALESPKIDIFQKWSWDFIGYVSRCLESKFDKRIPMGSVPNFQ